MMGTEQDLDEELGRELNTMNHEPLGDMWGHNLPPQNKPRTSRSGDVCFSHAKALKEWPFDLLDILCFLQHFLLYN